jgi:hypothetical protein
MGNYVELPDLKKKKEWGMMARCGQWELLRVGCDHKNQLINV